MIDHNQASSPSTVGFPRGRLAFLATGNLHKFKEARAVLSEHGIAVAMLQRIAPLEIQDDSIEHVASASAVDAVSKCNLPLVVEDAGLFIPALRDFPGPYSAYVYRTIGNDGILKLLEGVAERKAYFKSVIAFHGPSLQEPLCFNGQIRGDITEQERGGQGFGFDPIFQPATSSHTFAEMTRDEKNQCSHRAAALRSFAAWFTSGL